MRLLFVDCHSHVSPLCIALLAQRGQVEVARSVRAAWRALQNAAFDAAVVRQSPTCAACLCRLLKREASPDARWTPLFVIDPEPPIFGSGAVEVTYVADRRALMLALDRLAAATAARR